MFKSCVLLVLLGAGTLMAQSDNRYCENGDIAKFGAEKDGPAILPKRCINTAIASTPSPGKTINVRAGENVNEALEKAACGDQVMLQAGAVFAPFKLPAKKCDAQHWITVRTSAPDSSLPPEGVRLTPCYGGVSSLSARPAYSCKSGENVLAKVQLKSGAGAITVDPGANHYRLIGLEITRTPETGTVYGLVRFERDADHIILDRCWIHGMAMDETARGVYLGSATSTAVVDSYFSDFHCIAVEGACTDAQAITGGNSRFPMGPYKIVNNFLEAAAENILFGGAGGSQIPGDIEIRRNYLFKPLTWMPSSPNFIGKKFIAKNLFELKNAERVLFEGNVLENSWGGFSQAAFGVLLTPRGSWAAVQDVTIRYDLISHTGSGLQLAASRADQGGDSLAAQRWSIHDVVIDGLDPSTYNGNGIAFQISSGFGTNLPLNNISIDHVTVVAAGGLHNLMVVGASPSNSHFPFAITFTNNIVPGGQYSVWSTGNGENGRCARSGDPIGTFKGCWSSFKVAGNAIVDYDGRGSWPPGNFMPKNMRAVGFTNFNQGNGGDYHLSATSPYRGKGSDGKDLGADVDGLNAAIAGVR